MKNKVNAILFTIVMCTTSMALAVDSKMQILACGKVKVSTNTAEAGMIGASVMTTFVEIGNYTFKLNPKDDNQSVVVSHLMNGEEITVFGVFKTEIDPHGSETIVKNLDGSIDLELGSVMSGCYDLK